eukprot:scaffold125951_cov39-Tisochrysis_lutea.AAC.4
MLDATNCNINRRSAVSNAKLDRGVGGRSLFDATTCANNATRLSRHIKPDALALTSHRMPHCMRGL